MKLNIFKIYILSIRLKFFSAQATNYVKKLFWTVVNERKNSGTNYDNDLVSLLMEMKENLRLPAEDEGKLKQNTCYNIVRL